MMAARDAQRASDRVKAALVAAKERAAVARQGLVAADREVTKLTAEAEAADAELPTKRQCTRAPLKAWETATKGWSAEQWSAFEAAEQKRRAKPIDNDTEDADLKRGAEGFLHDFRRGLLGAVQSWANGRKKAVVHMVMSLIGSMHGFGIESEVRERLADPAVKREAQTNAYIVDRLAATIDVFKQFGTGDQAGLLVGRAADVKCITYVSSEE